MPVALPLTRRNHVRAAVAGLLFVAALQLAGIRSARAEPNFLGSISTGMNTYPSIAILQVDSLVDGNLDGMVDHTYTVTGNITLWNSSTLDNFTDPFNVAGNTPGPMVGTSGDGFNTVRMEVVALNNVMVTSDTSGAGSVVIGDGMGNGMDDGVMGGEPRSFYSTGGAAEIGPDGSMANGFLNLFMEIDVTEPQINIPPFGSFNIGELHNKDAPLHLEAEIEAFLPFHVPFIMPPGSPPVGMFTRSSHPLAQATGGQPFQLAQFVGAQITIIPEASSIAMGAVGLAAFLGLAWRKRKRSA